MNEDFSTKVDLMKALAILLVVSGHLEFSLLGIFTPYSFQLALFFFISGYLFKDKYLNDVVTFIERRFKSLLVLLVQPVLYGGYNTDFSPYRQILGQTD